MYGSLKSRRSKPTPDLSIQKNFRAVVYSIIEDGPIDIEGIELTLKVQYPERDLIEEKLDSVLNDLARLGIVKIKNGHLEVIQRLSEFSNKPFEEITNISILSAMEDLKIELADVESRANGISKIESVSLINDLTKKIRLALAG